MVNISHYNLLYSTITFLSGGQQQVAIVRVLALSHDIFCFDEATSNLDPELKGEVLKVIQALADKNTTMVIATYEI